MCQFKTLANLFLIILFALSCSNNSPKRKHPIQIQEFQNYMDTIGHYNDSISKNNTKARYDSIKKVLMKESENKIKEIEKNYEDTVEALILKTATSPEMMEVFDGLFKSALVRSSGDIESAKEILRIVLAPELSDERILEKYFENVEVIEDNLGNWKIVSKKKQK